MLHVSHMQLIEVKCMALWGEPACMMHLPTCMHVAIGFQQDVASYR